MTDSVSSQGRLVSQVGDQEDSDPISQDPLRQGYPRVTTSYLEHFREHLQDSGRLEKTK